MAGRSEHRLEYRRLRAPAGDGDVLIDPPAGDVAALVDENLRRSASRDFQIGGRSIRELADDARAHLISTAQEYTRHYAQPSWIDTADASRVYLVGHQPELFHPGVWLKNFVLDRLARRDGATAIHVLTDSDVASHVEVRTPTGSLDEPRIENIALDRSGPPMAWEERQLADPDVFCNAGQRMATAISPFVEDPLVSRIWPSANQPPSVGDNLGSQLARMRHQLELTWGLRTLDVPLSQLCQCQSYHWFIAYLLSELPRLHAAYNTRLDEYRRLHRLRTRSHPVPDLQADGERFESPFWIWTAADPRRRRLYARRTETALELGDGQSLSFKLPRPSSKDNVAELSFELTSLAAEGVKIRPRALMTTMYLRLLLSDLFIHGIGGAKYDQITDCLIEDVFGFSPPRYLTVSGTRLLPVDRPVDIAETKRQLDRTERDLQFHPENYIDASLTSDRQREADALLAEKRELLADGGPAANTRGRHESLKRINAALHDYVSNQRERLRLQRIEVERNIRAADVFCARDFSFCLFSEATLRPWLLDAAANAS